ncbi:MAG: Ig-like domain-containing protein, partial [Candidatus Latescibacteria bacterium]|nr:Ig-like domain-containing protein [Candidatus Latescibacterota bacterium]
SPEPDQNGVRRSSNVTITFSETMDGSSVAAEHFKLMRGGEVVAGTFSYDAQLRTALFDPAEELAQDTEYEARVSSSVRDSVGNRMAEDFRWGFRTARVVAVWPGGTLENEAETVSLFLPPNALDADEEIALREVSENDLTPLPEGYTTVGVGILFEAAGVDTLRKPATLRFFCEKSGEGTLAIFRRDDSDSDWKRLGGTVDVLNQGAAITTAVRRLGAFAVFEGAAPSGVGGVFSVDCQPRVFSPKGGGLNAETDISFELGAASEVTIEIYDEAGRLMRVVTEDERMQPGGNAKAWDGKDADGDVVPSGMYIVVIRIGDKVEAKKTVVVWNN